MNFIAKLVAVACIINCTIGQEEYCYGTDTVRSQNTHFSTKTAYQFIKGSNLEQLANVPNCTPVKFWLLSRHGTRLPELDVIQDMGILETRRAEIIQNYADGKSVPGGLCNEDLALLRNWVLDKNITADHEQFLVDQGWNDLYILATDYQAIFPELLPKKYDNKNFYFRHSDFQRTEASYKAFTEGLFGPKAYDNIKLDPIPVNDTLLGPQNVCDKFISESSESKDPDSDIDKFMKSDIMKEVLVNVSKRLRYEEPLDFRNVTLMFEMCRFEQAWFLNRSSPWCSTLTLKEIQVLEYLEDLKHQNKAGYKHELNENLACEVIQDMMKRLETNDDPTATIYVSHSTLNQLVFVGLGAFKDDRLLTADDFGKTEDRKWRMSSIGPFTANIAAVKYNCSTNGEAPVPKLKLFLNQKILELDWCKDGLCDLQEFKNRYKRFYDADCPSYYCSTESGSEGLDKVSFLVVVTVVLYNLFV